MFDKNKLLTQLDSLMSLAAANDIEYQAGQFSHVKNVAETLATLLSKKAEEEAAAEKAAAEKAVAEKVANFTNKLAEFDLTYFLLNRGSKTFFVMAKAINEQCGPNMVEAMFQETICQLTDVSLYDSTVVELRDQTYLVNLVDKDLVPKSMRDTLGATFRKVEVGLTAKLYL